jgi:hypothetical protein
MAGSLGNSRPKDATPSASFSRLSAIGLSYSGSQLHLEVNPRPAPRKDAQPSDSLAILVKTLAMLDKSIEYRSANVGELVQAEGKDLVSCEVTIMLKRNPLDDSMVGTYNSTPIMFFTSSRLCEELRTLERLRVYNLPQAQDPLKCELESELKLKLYNFMLVPSRDLKKHMESVVLFANKTNRDDRQPGKFSVQDEMLGCMFVSISGVTRRYKTLDTQCRNKLSAIATVYKRFEEIARCVPPVPSRRGPLADLQIRWKPTVER